jgi:hypothetical protein
MSEKCCYDRCKFMRYGIDPSVSYHTKFYICIADGVNGVMIRSENIELLKKIGCKLYCEK